MSIAGAQLSEEMQNYYLAIETRAFSITVESNNQFSEPFLKRIIRLCINTLTPIPVTSAVNMIDIEERISRGVKAGQQRLQNPAKEHNSKLFMPQFSFTKKRYHHTVNQTPSSLPDQSAVKLPKARL